MIYIMRHGQTAGNHAKRLQGRSDLPLNETGRAQAAAVGEWFRSQGIRLDRVYSSPLCRAMETARLVAGDCPMQVDRRLIEMDYGPYEGADLTAPPPEVLAFFRDFVNTPAPEGMEPLDAVVARFGSFLEELWSEARTQNILISTHAVAMKGALEYLTPDAGGRYWPKNIGNCAVYQTECLEQGFSVPTEVPVD